jgi:hypothetical protein
VSLTSDLSARARESAAAGEIRIKLTNSAQGWHLCQALRGHCEVDLLPGSEGTEVVVVGSGSGSRPILRRLDAWLTEFGVEAISLELDGRAYEMRKT